MSTEAPAIQRGSDTLAPMEPTQLSPVAHARLVAELEHRSGPLKREIADRIERARELGDLKENADYDAAKNEQGLNAARVRQLEAMLRDAQIVDGADLETVQAGVVVELRMAGDDDTQLYLIGSIEERDERYEILSTSGPLGQAVVGRRTGETVSYETPRKISLEVEIVAIRPLD
jgi:transcription elongation factor GreA